MSNIRNQIINILKETTGFDSPNVEFASDPQFGDYSSNVAMVLAKEQKKNPHDLAEEIVEKINKDAGLSAVARAVVEQGFINFWLKKDVLVDNLIQIDEAKEKYGKSEIGKGKTVIIDYSAPNIAKPFGIGHLRSTIIGQALYNLYKFLGYEVVGDNHLGDWGTQFGKLLYMIDSTKTDDFSIENLEKLYVDFHKLVEEDPKLEEMAREWFKKLEDGDSEAKKLWQKCIDISLSEFARVYDLLGVKIDFAFGESYYEAEMKQMVSVPSVKKYLTKGEDGALIVDLSKEGIKTPLMFLKSDGATTYATRDLATIKFRIRKWDPEIIIYEVGAEQSLHFEQVFTSARLLGLVGKKVNLVHTKHGLYLAPDGKKFSTRKGKTVKLDEVLVEAIGRAKKLGSEDSETAKKVGIGAIKYYDLMHSVQSNVVFDWEKIMNMEGNSGPYLQYTIARTNSVLAKAINHKSLIINHDLVLGDQELNVLRLLTRFGEVVEQSASAYSPNILCNYLYDLAQKFNSFYNKYPILKPKDPESAENWNLEIGNFRLALTSGVSQVLKNGLDLLGIQSPERM